MCKIPHFSNEICVKSHTNRTLWRTGKDVFVCSRICVVRFQNVVIFAAMKTRFIVFVTIVVAAVMLYGKGVVPAPIPEAEETAVGAACIITDGSSATFVKSMQNVQTIAEPSAPASLSIPQPAVSNGGAQGCQAAHIQIHCQVSSFSKGTHEQLLATYAGSRMFKPAHRLSLIGLFRI